MKKQLLMQIAALLIISAVLSGCNRPAKQTEAASGEPAAVNVVQVNNDEIKTELINIIRNAPKPLDIAVLANEAGASYISDLILQDDEYQKMMTTTQKAFGIGVIGFDCKYTSVFNRPDEYIKCRSNLNKFMADLGLQEVLANSKRYEDRIDQNKSNADSLKYLVSKIVDNFNQSVQNEENAELYALVFMGANVEAIYTVSQLTLMAQNNEKLLSVLNNQHEHAKTIASLLERMKDREDVKPYYEKIQPMIVFFAEKDVFTIDDLKEISPLIEEARNSMIQI